MWKGYVAEMGRIAVELGNSARDVVLSGDPEKAAEIDREDDAMDDLHRHLFTVLMNREWKHAIASAVDVTLLGRGTVNLSNSRAIFAGSPPRFTRSRVTYEALCG
jgi:phosphate uptake regulator